VNEKLRFWWVVILAATIMLAGLLVDLIILGTR